MSLPPIGRLCRLAHYNPRAGRFATRPQGLVMGLHREHDIGQYPSVIVVSKPRWPPSTSNAPSSMAFQTKTRRVPS